MTTPATNTISTIILNTIKHNWILAITSKLSSCHKRLFLEVIVILFLLPKSIYRSNSIFRECDTMKEIIYINLTENSNQSFISKISEELMK